MDADYRRTGEGRCCSSGCSSNDGSTRPADGHWRDELISFNFLPSAASSVVVSDCLPSSLMPGRSRHACLTFPFHSLVGNSQN